MGQGLPLLHRGSPPRGRVPDKPYMRRPRGTRLGWLACPASVMGITPIMAGAFTQLFSQWRCHPCSVAGLLDRKLWVPVKSSLLSHVPTSEGDACGSPGAAMKKQEVLGASFYSSPLFSRLKGPLFPDLLPLTDRRREPEGAACLTFLHSWTCRPPIQGPCTIWVGGRASQL